jgi:hypothetical protein
VCLLDTLLSVVALNIFVYYIMISVKRTISNLADLVKTINITKKSSPRKHSPKSGKPPRHHGNTTGKKKVEGIAMKGGKKNKTQRNKKN